MEKTSKTFVDSVFENIPKSLYFKVLLPSRGILYKSYDPAKGVTVRPVNFNDRLTMAKKKNEVGFSPIDFLYEQCVQGVKIEELLGMDRFSILLKIREISYGNEYKTETVCKYCGAENSLVFKLSDLPIEFLPEGFTDPREITLPVLNKKAKVRFPRNEEIDLIEKDGMEPNLWRFVESIEGTEDKTVIATILSDERFPLKDADELTKNIIGSDYGIQSGAQYKCADCNKINDARFELNSGFFSSI